MFKLSPFLILYHSLIVPTSEESADFPLDAKERYQKRIEQQAYTDFLTGLYNRMCCERDLARIIDETEKLHETGALLYLDLDDFKHINDGLGHQYGDVLKKANLKGVGR